MPPDDSLFVVRHWDGFDGEWTDMFGPDSHEKCQRYWDQQTHGGTQNTSYNDIDYYAIFPADTRMRFSEGRSMTRG